MAPKKTDPPGTLDLFAHRAAPAELPAAATGAALPTQPAFVATADFIAVQHEVGFLIPQEEISNHAALQHVSPTPLPSAQSIPELPRIYRVVELVRLAGRALESRFADVWVEGEISNLRAPGHCYFTLKDDEGQLPAVMFRASAARLRFRLSDGLKVRARGRLSIYDAQGKLQLYVEAMEPAGLGALQLAFEQLKRKLAAEGLFDPARKRPLPYLPRRIGIATSATGAAVRDIIRVIERRGPSRLVIAPCLVQGAEAPADVIRALAALQQIADIDLIIVGRGGGSTEDLAAFNDEALARAIAACRVPVISAVGHEVDFTIADFVADKRAATPSQAAELAVPVHAELGHRLADLETRLGRAGRRSLADARLRLDEELDTLDRLLQRKIDLRRRALVSLDSRLGARHPRARLARDRGLLDALARRLEPPPLARVVRARRDLAPLETRLHAAMQHSLRTRRSALGQTAGTLNALSPLKVLERGYGLVRGPSGAIVTDAVQIFAGDLISVSLARGSLVASVISVDEEDKSPNGDGNAASGADEGKR